MNEVIELDSFLLTHGPSTAISSQDVAFGKRKESPSRTKGDVPGPSKRAKHPAYLLPDLSHVVALCDERIPFAALAAQLTRREILHQGLSVEAHGTALSLKLVCLPPVEGVPKAVMLSLNRRLIAATIRIQVKGSRAWMFEFIFNGTPLVSTSPWEQGRRFPVYLTYDVTTADEVEFIYFIFNLILIFNFIFLQTGRTVDAILQDWAHIANLYSAVLSFSNTLKKKGERNHFSVKSYNYKKIIFNYGPARAATAAVTWKLNDKKFNLALGCSGQLGSNPHSPIREQLEFFLNQQKSVGYLAQVLHETYEPLASIAKLPSTLHLGVLYGKHNVPVQTFTVIPHSPTHLRLAYFNLYCLDVRLLGNGQVSIRDGAFSIFDKSKVLEEFLPTQGLKVKDLKIYSLSCHYCRSIVHFLTIFLIDFVSSGLPIEVRG